MTPSYFMGRSSMRMPVPPSLIAFSAHGLGNLYGVRIQSAFPSPPADWKNATSLRKLTLSDIDDEIRTSFRNNRITSLQFYGDDDDYDVFKLFPHLQHLDITLPAPRMARRMTFQPSELRSTILKSLTVRIASWDLRWTSPVLSSLHLPSLVSLELLIKRGLDDIDIDIDKDSLMPSLETMFRQSSPPLQSFKIDSDHSLTSVQLLDILSWMPLLTDLSIHVISTVLHEGFLARLTYIPGSKSLPTYPTYTPEKITSCVLLPRLKSLEIGIDFETNIEVFLPDVDSIIAMVASRIAHSSSADNNHDDSLVDKLSHLTVLIPYFRYQSERVWAEGFRTTLKKHLQKHMGQGFTCTVILGETSSGSS
ncbi:hypothetical protein K435DRAFT_873764 [Dendrothele bispora CBS 962.96]|uniref:F-box domain-containing protein n=1 Tax=Dendrothele bispora (strain CBS 962.96) TaxID=1314807 RepID=A0A4S8KYK2_DENBC|nr:hypothetical protein K435DRAFT_873764 [Dendrothele bispora CBS 962.96]